VTEQVSGTAVKLVIRTFTGSTSSVLMGYHTSNVSTNADTSLGTLTLPPTATYRVRFIDSIGQPVENVLLGGSAAPVGGSDVGWPLTETLTTSSAWIGLSARTEADGILEFRGGAGGWAMPANYTDPTDGVQHSKWVESRFVREDGFITITFDDLIAPQRPSPPQSVTATAADGQAHVSWAVPASDGGAPVTAYEVRATVEGQREPVQVMSASGSSTDLQVIDDMRRGTA